MLAPIKPLEPILLSGETFDKMQKNKLPGESDDAFIARLVEKADSDIIGIDEVAKLLQLSKASVYRLTHLHLIPFFKPGKYLIFSRAAIMAYISRRRFLSHEDMRNEAARLVAR